MNTMQLILVLALLFVLGCEKEDQLTERSFDTEFIEIIKNCRADKIKDTTFLKENIIGNWKLIATGGYFPPHLDTYPYLEFRFQLDQGQLFYFSGNGEPDSIKSFTWNVYMDTLLISETEDSIFFTGIISDPDQWQLSHSQFCAEYFFYDFRAQDGSYQIFEKQ